MAAPPGTALLNDLAELFPWIAQMGISTAWLQGVAAEAQSSTEIVQQIRNTPQYKQRFPGLTRQDGTLRMNEAQYIQQEASYRTLLKQFGYDVDTHYNTPQALVGFFQGDVAPDELEARLQVYRQVQQGGQRIKDDYYVYAGLNVTDDDLFEAMVDPGASQELSNAFNQSVAAKPLDYKTFIARATALGKSKVVKTLQALQKRGAVTAEAVQRIIATDPAFAQKIMDSIYHGGDPANKAGFLSLHEMQDAFEFAVVGAAAQSAGLELPTKERLAAIRAAGVDSAKMIGSYTAYGQNQSLLDANVARARGHLFGQTQFENAQFFGDAAAANDLLAGQNYNEAAGKRAGTFRVGEEHGRLVQSGLSNYG